MGIETTELDYGAITPLAQLTGTPNTDINAASIVGVSECNLTDPTITASQTPAFKLEI